MPDADVLTLREVAALLRVAEKTAYTLVQTGDLPGFKVGGQWRFRRSDIDAWITSQTLRPTSSAPDLNAKPDKG